MSDAKLVQQLKAFKTRCSNCEKQRNMLRKENEKLKDDVDKYIHIAFDFECKNKKLKDTIDNLHTEIQALKEIDKSEI